ncbi:MAG: addiction module antitoxin [Gammaproteobacteria bacterium]|jgi:predicted CopG family antitoxin|nr:addiction module antitoxin [Gammaproteobacteria bacterium]
MQKKLTITVSEEVYNGLYQHVGRRRISKFIENLARPHVLEQDLLSAYQAMAADSARESAALAWSEATVSDIDHATW